jgi:hypothetical protein
MMYAAMVKSRVTIELKRDEVLTLDGTINKMQQTA